MDLRLLCAICCATLLAATLTCEALRRFAVARALVDKPNERSLHVQPVPRLGGVAIFAVAWLGALVLLGTGRLATNREVVAWLCTSPVIAFLGLWDDLKPLSASLRFPVQIAAASALLYVVGVPREIVIAGSTSIALPVWVVAPSVVVFIVGALNIYNFMDGMDGLAGSQAVASGIAIAFACAMHGSGDLALVVLLCAVASVGFLINNWPQARVFMGDMGSTFLGFTFASVTVIAMRRSDPVPFPVGVIALAPFLLDGTFTIFRRLRKGEKIWEAHRSHLYQRAVATGLTHRDVLLPYVVWMTIATGAAVIAAGGRATAMIVAAGAAIVPLLVTWRWVRGRESSGG